MGFSYVNLFARNLSILEAILSRFTFLHAADIHLDSPMRGLSRYEGVPTEQVRGATRAALTNLVEYAVAEKVSFLIIAGDVFDGEWDNIGTGLFFCAQMGKLEKANIPVYMVRGNHDAVSVMSKRLPMPGNVNIFNHEEPERLVHEPTGTVLHGQSYGQRDPGGNLALRYRPAKPGHFNVGILHTSLAENTQYHMPYSPCNLAELCAKDYDYWALGHVHEFRQVCDAPYVVFPGNLQGRDIRELGPKGAVLVTVDNAHVEKIKRIYVDALRWCSAEIDVSGLNDLDMIRAQVRESLGRAVSDQSDGRPLMVRVSLIGATALHGELANFQSGLRDDVRAIAAAVSDSIWIEKVRVLTHAAPNMNGLPPELFDIEEMLRDGAQDAEFAVALKADFRALIAQVPGDLSSGDFLKPVRDGELAPVIAEAASALMARLRIRGN